MQIIHAMIGAMGPNETIFDACVELLVWTANVCGTSYKAINVYIFVIAWPMLLVSMGAMLIWQRRKIAALERRCARTAS
jgi:hypothetical protein